MRPRSDGIRSNRCRRNASATTALLCGTAVSATFHPCKYFTPDFDPGIRILMLDPEEGPAYSLLWVAAKPGPEEGVGRRNGGEGW